MHGQFIWYELTTPDVDAARKFYPKFTGWGTQPFDKDYMMWTTGGVPFAGLFRLNDEMRQRGIPPNWMPYIESSDVDETVRKATSLGGRAMAGPADIPNVGRYAVLLDPQGAAFGVYKSNSASNAWDGTAVIGRPSWHELMTTDYASAFAFYQALFGWEQTGDAMDMGGGNMYFMYGKGGKMYGGIYNRTPDMAGMNPFWLVYFHVKDVGKAVAAATKAGATVQRPQMDIPGGSIAILGDPQGAGFALHHTNAQAAAPATAPKKKAAARTATKRAAKAPARKAAVKKKAAPKKKAVTKKAARKKTAGKSSRPKAKARTASRRKTKARKR